MMFSNPPAAAMWLSFTRIMSYNPNLCGSPPPRAIAFFSNLLNPGVVFLVPDIMTVGDILLQTSVASCTMVAIPLILIMMLRAVLSAVVMLRNGPSISMTFVPGLT